MLAAVVARHYARYLAGEPPPHAFFTSWRADRFADSGSAPPTGGERETMTIG